MEYIRISAKTVDDAITEASIQLGTSSDNIEYEVVWKRKAPVFLGFGKQTSSHYGRARKEETAPEENFEEEVETPVNRAVTGKPAAEAQRFLQSSRERQPVTARSSKAGKNEPVRRENRQHRQKSRQQQRPAREKAPAG